MPVDPQPNVLSTRPCFQCRQLTAVENVCPHSPPAIRKVELQTCIPRGKKNTTLYVSFPASHLYLNQIVQTSTGCVLYVESFQKKKKFGSFLYRIKIISLKIYLQLCPMMMDLLPNPGISKQCVPNKELNKSLLIIELNCSGYIKAI